MLAVAAVMLALSGAAPALAQRCSADSQCARPGSERSFSCQGSVLVSHERRCLGGQCRDTTETRVDCGGGVGLGNCDPSSGRCRTSPEPRVGRGNVSPDDDDERAAMSMCPPRCICNGRTLIIVTGRKAHQKGKRCDTIETACKTGCTCKPEPRCLDAPRRPRP